MHEIQITDTFSEQFSYESNKNSFKFDNFILKNTEADKCCRLEGDIPFLIEEFVDQHGSIMIIGRRFQEVSPFFMKPLNSQVTLGILQCKRISENTEIFPVTAVQFKYMQLLYKTNYILIPL